NGSGFRVIHRFCSVANCGDGSSDVGSLLIASDGNLYGVTQQGGSANVGTIFRVIPSTGKYEVVFNFSASSGELPLGAILAHDGSIYGVTINGSTLFHYTPGSGFQSIKLSFPLPDGCAGFGCFATGQLTFGANGDLYGLYAIYDVGGIGLFEMQAD